MRNSPLAPLKRGIKKWNYECFINFFNIRLYFEKTNNTLTHPLTHVTLVYNSFEVVESSISKEELRSRITNV